MKASDHMTILPCHTNAYIDFRISKSFADKRWQDDHCQYHHSNSRSSSQTTSQYVISIGIMLTKMLLSSMQMTAFQWPSKYLTNYSYYCQNTSRYINNALYIYHHYFAIHLFVYLFIHLFINSGTMQRQSRSISHQ